MKTIKQLEKEIEEHQRNVKALEDLPPKNRKSNYLFIVGEEIDKLRELKTKLQTLQEVCKEIEEEIKRLKKLEEKEESDKKLKNKHLFYTSEYEKEINLVLELLKKFQGN